MEFQCTYRVEPQLCPGKETRGQVISEDNVVDKGIIFLRGAVPSKGVLEIGRLGDLVRVVGFELLDGVDELLVKEELGQVGHDAAGVCSIVEDW